MSDLLGAVMCIAVVAATEWACACRRRNMLAPGAPPSPPPSHVRRLPR